MIVLFIPFGFLFIFIFNYSSLSGVTWIIDESAASHLPDSIRNLSTVE